MKRIRNCGHYPFKHKRPSFNPGGVRHIDPGFHSSLNHRSEVVPLVDPDLLQKWFPNCPEV